MTRVRSASTAAVVLALVTTGSLLSAPSQAAVPTRATLTFSTTRPIVGESFDVSGQVSTRFRRPVVLRELGSSGTWRVVQRTSSSPTGGYRFRGVSTAVPRRYSVLVPTTRHARRVYGRVMTPRRLVRPVQQSATIDVLPQVAQPGRVPAAARLARSLVVARFTPARPGRGVIIRKRLDDDTWVVAGRPTQRADGTAYFVGATHSGTHAYAFRATTTARSGARAVSTGMATDTWAMKLSDQFAGASLDPGTWSYRVGAAPSRTHASNDRRAVSVGGGTLRMKVLRDPARSGRWLNGQVATDGKFSFTYGMASARVRFAPGRGQHGSFWMQSPTYRAHPGDPGRSGAEVDVVEFFGRGYPDGGLASFTYHVDASGKDVKAGGVWPQAAALLPRTDTWWNSFHVFSVKWTPTSYTFYVDGQVLFTTSSGVSRTDEYLLLSLLTSDWELPHFNLAGAGTMAVDWVRVWQTPRTS
jgi:beta-glucanase (GH16 family)